MMFHCQKWEDEEAMLSEAFYVKSNSRLGCQIPITFRRIGTRAGSRKLKKASHVNVTL
jgi:hypothetical protein